MRCSVDDVMSDACAVAVAAEHAAGHGRAVRLEAGERFAGTTADARTMERGCLIPMPVQEMAHCAGSRVPWRYTETGRFFFPPGNDDSSSQQVTERLRAFAGVDSDWCACQRVQSSAGVGPHACAGPSGFVGRSIGGTMGCPRY